MAQPPDPPGDVLTLSRRQIAVLASPLCLELIEALRLEGAASVRELGARVGRLPGSLYYHVRRLAQARLIRVVEERPTARRPEAVYGVVAGTLRIDPRLNAPSDRRQVQALVRRRLRQVEREHEAALEDPGIVREGRARELLVRTTAGRLRPAALARLNRLLAEACELVQRESTETGRRVTLTVILTPRSRERP